MDQVHNAPRHPSRRSWRVALAVLSGLIAGALIAAAGLAFWYVPTHRHDISQIQDRLLQASDALEALQARHDVLEGQLAVERSTRQGLESLLESTQQELGAARDQIAFFNELSPPGPEGSISIRAFDIHPEGDWLRFRVLLMRHVSGTTAFEGQLQFQATGRMAGSDDTITLTLEPARITNGSIPDDADPTSPDGESPEQKSAGSVLALQLDRFQRSGGFLQLPAGFDIREVTVNVLENDRVRASRTIDFPFRQLSP